MKKIKAFMLVLLLWVGGMNAVFAQSGWSTNTYEADGIQYYLNNTTREAKVAIGNYSGEIVIPEYIWPVHPGNQESLIQANNPYWGGYRVTDYAYVNNSGSIQTPFSSNTNITKVILPQSIRAIKDGTFQNCTQLEEVRLLGCFFTNSYATDTQSPTGTHSSNVFSGCTSLRRMYADDPRVVCVRRRYNSDTGKYENYCPLEAVLGTNTTTNLALYHNAGVALASYFDNRIIKQEQTSFTNSKLQVTIDFFPNGDVSYIDYGYTLNSLYACNVTEASHAITERQTTIDCLKQGSKTFVLRDVPNVSPYLKPYIQVGDAAPVPMCIFGNTFYYTVYANPDANSNTNVRIMYMSSSTWGGGLVVETPGDITVYVDNQKKISDYQEAGTYSVASPQNPFTTYEIALDYDPQRYTVKAFDANNQEYQLLEQYSGMTNGVFRKGKYYFRTTGSASYLDYQVKLTATDIPMEIWYEKSAGIKLTISGKTKGNAFSITKKNPQGFFSSDPEQTVTLRLDNVPNGLDPYVVAARERLELTKVTEDGTTYYTTSFVPHYGAFNYIEIGTTQIIEDGEILTVNITKVGNGRFSIQEPNDWYDFDEEDPEDGYIEGNPYHLRDMEEDGDTQSFDWAYAYNEGNVQNILFVADIPETAEGITESVRVNVNGADVEPTPQQSWYYFFVPISDHLDIQLIHESNARYLQVKNSNGNGSITIYDADGVEQLSVPANDISESKKLVKQAGYYAIIQPKAGKELSAIFTSGMQQLLPPSSYQLGDGTYYVPLADFETDAINDYQLSVLYTEQTEVEPWIYAIYDPIYDMRFDNWWYTLPESHRRAVKGMKINDVLISPALEILRSISGQSYASGVEPFSNSLRSLDMTNAKLRKVEEMYFYRDGSTQYGINQDNVWPAHFLAGMEIDTLWLPKALESIEQGSFEGAKSSLVVYAPWRTPLDLSSSSGFGDEVAQMDLYVPAGSFDAYAADPEWSKFGFIWEYGTIEPEIIQFADAEVKRICVENWDTDGDGELSKDEAAAVTTLKKDNGDGTFGDPVFKGNTTITSFDELQYFTGLEALPENAFNGCNKLNSIILPKNIIVIPQYCFAGCNGFTSFTVPEGVVTIVNNAFRNCKGITSISFPQTLITLEGAQFDNAGQKIKTLVIPKNVTSLGSSTSLVSNFDNLVVESGNTKYDSREGCGCIILTASNKVLYGSNNARIPDGVKIIGSNAFMSLKNLKKIELPSSVTTIEGYAFAYTDSLKSVVSKIENPASVSLGTDAFKSVHADCVLTVPYGKTDAYRAAGWGDGKEGSPAIFKEIVEDMSQYDVNRDKAVNITDVTTLVNKILGK